MGKPLTWTEDDRCEFFALVDRRNAQHAIYPPSQLSNVTENLFSMEVASTRAKGHAAIERIEKIIGDIATLGTTPEKRYKGYLARIIKTPYGKRLDADKHFGEAHGLFLKKQRSKNEAGYKDQWAELHFLDLCCTAGMYASQISAGHKRLAPSSTDVTQAIKRIKSLKLSLMKGIQLDDLSETARLKDLLEKLCKELNTKPEKKPRVDSTQMGRAFVKFATKFLMHYFGEASPGIVINLAHLIEYTATDSTINAQIAKVREKQPPTANNAARKVSKKSA